jgi:hypothetical protein
VDSRNDLPAADQQAPKTRSAAKPGSMRGFRLRPKPMFKPKRIPKSKLKFTRKLRDCGEAEHQMCRAIAALGTLAGVDVGMGHGPADMDKLLILAAHQCYFDDAEFMDGPCCFNFVKTVIDADILKLQADAVALGLASYIRQHGDQASIDAAGRQLALVDGAFAWLRKSVAG